MNSSKRIIIAFFTCLCLAIINGYLFNYLNNHYLHYKPTDNGMASFGKTARFMLIVFAAPIVETALFNWAPNWALNRLQVTNRPLLIIIPSVIFAIFHIYNPLYATMAFIGGLIMNWYYLYCLQKKQLAFWLVAALHAAYNLFGFLFVD